METQAERKRREDNDRRQLWDSVISSAVARSPAKFEATIGSIVRGEAVPVHAFYALLRAVASAGLKAGAKHVYDNHNVSRKRKTQEGGQA